MKKLANITAILVTLSVTIIAIVFACKEEFFFACIYAGISSLIIGIIFGGVMLSIEGNEFHFKEISLLKSSTTIFIIVIALIFFEYLKIEKEFKYVMYIFCSGCTTILLILDFFGRLIYKDEMSETEETLLEV